MWIMPIYRWHSQFHAALPSAYQPVSYHKVWKTITVQHGDLCSHNAPPTEGLVPPIPKIYGPHVGIILG